MTNLSFDFPFEPAVALKFEKLNPLEEHLHQAALLRAASYREAEAALLEIIIQVDQMRLFRKFDLNSTFPIVSSCCGFQRRLRTILFPWREVRFGFPS